MHLVEGFDEKLVNALAREKNLMIKQLVGQEREKEKKKTCAVCGRSRLSTRPDEPDDDMKRLGTLDGQRDMILGTGTQSEPQKNVKTSKAAVETIKAKNDEMHEQRGAYAEITIPNEYVAEFERLNQIPPGQVWY